ncbi:hypothetical protein [Nocardia australiensis]|uniref:hypothetical protein n=1 Tax=Nocardia australiensis TaxID=2887191 RepID=UPI001D14484F|nr:hypothetical protein [Nocardia australiensis]
MPSDIRLHQAQTADTPPAVELELPQRNPNTGPPTAYVGPPADIVERYAHAIHEWAHQPAPTEPSRCRGAHSPGTGRTNQEAQ